MPRFERISSIIDNSPLPACLVGANFEILCQNNFFRVICPDFSFENENYLSPEDLKKFKDLFSSLHSFQISIHLHTVDRDIPYLLTCTIFTDSGQKLGLCSFQETLTFEQQLSKISTEKERLETIINAVPDIIFKIDPEGKFTYLNDAVSFLNYLPEELLGEHFSKIIHTEDLQEVAREKVLPRYLGHPTGPDQAPKLFDERRSFTRRTENLEIRLLKNCENHEQSVCASLVSWGEVSSTGIYNARKNSKEYSFSGTVGIIHNLSDIRKRESLLRKLYSAIEQSPVSILIMDDLGIIEYVNPEYIHKKGYSPSEIIGQNFQEIYQEELKDPGLNQLWNKISQGETLRKVIYTKKKTLDYYWEMISISPVQDEKGKISNYVLIGKDITSRIELESQLIESKETAEKANQAKSDFLANMSHELRTPLNGILGFTELLLQLTKDPTVLEYLDLIRISGQKLLHIVKELLEIIMLESGQHIINPISFSLKQLLEQILLINEKMNTKKTVVIRLDFPPDIPEFLISDALKIDEIISNLLHNAIKFTDQGNITLKVEPVKKNTSTLWLKFSISDTGSGIPSQKMSQIFDLFTQGEDYLSKKHAGVGLGLSIVKKLVLILEGEITVQSQADQGSIFSVILPFQLIP